MNSRKLKKLIRSPKAFFIDAINKKLGRINDINSNVNPNNKRIITYTFGFSTWKQFLRKYFPERQFEFFPKGVTEKDLPVIREKLLSKKNIEVFIWGVNLDQSILSFIEENKIPHYFVEDGFIRSVKLGAVKSPPRSLSLDSRTPYFDARSPSDLEVLLSTYDFAKHPELLARSRRLISLMIKNNISKYNNSRPVDVEKIYGEKNKKRILVVGQVEDDASIKYGCDRPITNYDLLKMACDENPDAQIFYKEHPDVLAGTRQSNSNMQALKARCQLLMNDFPLSQALTSIDHVYTISSLSGFEALLRGIKVTTLGCPFYSGWDLTDDRQANSRRQRTLSVEELFAGAYILYPKYFDPETGVKQQPEDVVNEIIKEREAFLSQGAEKPKTGRDNIVNVASKPKKCSDRALEDHDLIWFHSASKELQQSAENSHSSGCHVFFYLPWQNSDIYSQLFSTEDVKFIPLGLIDTASICEFRNEIENYISLSPDLFNRSLINYLIPFVGLIKGVIFRSDVNIVERMLAFACEQVGIPKLLIPENKPIYNEENLFSNKALNISLPLADMVLLSLENEKDILLSRGYADNRIKNVPSLAKVDFNASVAPHLENSVFNDLVELSVTDGRIMFFSPVAGYSGTPDIESIISLVASYAKINKKALLIKCRKNEDVSYYSNLCDNFDLPEDLFYIESSDYPLIPDDELIRQSKVVISLDTYNIDMLLDNCQHVIVMDASRNNNVSVNYTGRLLLLNSIDELQEHLSLVLNCNKKFEDNNDPVCGHSPEKNTYLSSKLSVSSSNSLDRLFNNETMDIVAIPSSQNNFNSVQKYLQRQVRARTIINTSIVRNCSFSQLCGVEVFLQWGIRNAEKENASRVRQRELAQKLRRPLVIIEDGFLRSIDIGLSGEPGLSIILDDVTAYYDATKVSRLSRLLENGRELMDDEISRARNAIRKIVSSKVSKYNHAPDLPVKIGTAGRTKVLLIDQRFGDQSVTSGLASENSFERMLMDAVKNNPDKDIIIKQHPDAIKGGKSSYYSDERLSAIKYMDNVYTINFDINPYSLLDLVDDVYVVTSGMGFEALMAGKRVHCYGMPFYAGWGVTDDQISLPSRTRKRSLEELFHFSYIESSRYFDPDKDEVVPVEEIINYIVRHRGW